MDGHDGVLFPAQSRNMCAPFCRLGVRTQDWSVAGACGPVENGIGVGR